MEVTKREEELFHRGRNGRSETKSPRKAGRGGGNQTKGQELVELREPRETRNGRPI